MTGTTQKKRIISFDLDMTLLSHRNWKIPESAMRAWKLLRKENILVIASGRDMNSAMNVLYRDMLKPDGIIHTNGTLVEADGRILLEHIMDKGRIRPLLEYGESRKISVGTTLNGIDYYTCPEDVVYHDKYRWGESDRNFEDPWKLMELPVHTLVYIGGQEQIDDLEKEFPYMKFPVFSGKMGADIVEQEVSKAQGLLKLCQHYGIDMEQTAAFGDSMNDYEIIREAGIGVAMGNALEALKAAADYVTDDIDRDGVWKACCHFGWIQQEEADGKTV